MNPGNDYLHARWEARYHVQVEIEQVGRLDTGRPMPWLYWARINSVVKRIFRGDGLLKLDDKISFKVSVLAEGAQPADGGGKIINERSLSSCRFMEVFLHDEPPNCDAKEDNYFQIDALTDSPVVLPPAERPKTIAERQAEINEEIKELKNVRHLIPSPSNWND